MTPYVEFGEVGIPLAFEVPVIIAC
jgi:hypothetical protein